MRIDVWYVSVRLALIISIFSYAHFHTPHSPHCEYQSQTLFGLLRNQISNSFEGQISVGKNFSGFFFKFIQPVVFGTEMTDEELFYAGGFCDGSSLHGRTMISFGCTFFQILQIGGFVIQHIDAGHLFGNFRIVNGICRIGIRFGRWSRIGYRCIWDTVCPAWVS